MDDKEDDRVTAKRPPRLAREEPTTPLPLPPHVPAVEGPKRRRSGELVALRKSAEPPPWLDAIDESTEAQKEAIAEAEKRIAESTQRIIDEAIKKAFTQVNHTSGGEIGAPGSRTIAVQEAKAAVEEAKAVVVRADERVEKVETVTNALTNKFKGLASPNAQTTMFAVIQALALLITWLLSHPGK